MSLIRIIAAVSKNNVIGLNGKIPWNYKQDLEHFKFLTSGNIVIMGRKTFESIGRPLPDRFNIVVTKSKKYSGENLISVQSYEEALIVAKNILPQKDIFICGGEKLYEQAMKDADQIDLTLIKNDFSGDAFFPKIDGKIFIEIQREEFKDFDFITLKKSDK